MDSAGDAKFRRDLLAKFKAHINLLDEAVKAGDEGLVVVAVLRLAREAMITLCFPRFADHALEMFHHPTGGGALWEMTTWLNERAKKHEKKDPILR